MTKRVSIKGRGADLFFGDPTPDRTLGPRSDSDVVNGTGPDVIPDVNERPPGEVDAAPPPDTTRAAESVATAASQRLHARKNERMHERKNASMQETRIEEPTLGAIPSSALERVWRLVAQPATLPNAFRYTDQELTTLADVIYDVGKQHRVKVSKQDIARLGLNAVLQDYQERGDESLLGELVRRKKQIHGEGK